jgi:hypothetical protein
LEVVGGNEETVDISGITPSFDNFGGKHPVRKADDETSTIL